MNISWNYYFACAVSSVILLAAEGGELYQDYGSKLEERKSMLRARWLKFLPTGGPNQSYALEAAGNVMPDIPLAGAAGKTVVFSGMIRGEKIEAKDPKFGGVVFPIHYKLNGKSKFAGGVSPAIKSGSFDWTYHSIAEKIPKEATDVTIRFGLQQAAGRAFFSKLSIKLEEQP